MHRQSVLYALWWHCITASLFLRCVYISIIEQFISVADCVLRLVGIPWFSAHSGIFYGQHLPIGS